MAKKKQYRIKSRPDAANIIFRIVLYIWALVIILPLFWMIYTSVKERGEFIADRFKLPQNIWLANYQTAILSAGFSSLPRSLWRRGAGWRGRDLTSCFNSLYFSKTNQKVSVLTKGKWLKFRNFCIFLPR